MNIGPGLLKMEDLHEIRTQAREERSGINIHLKLSPMSGQWVLCWSWPAATAFPQLLR